MISRKSFSTMILLIAAIVVLSSIGIASDWVPSPGILSAEEVDFDGQTVTIIRGGVNEERKLEAEALFNVKIQTVKPDNVEWIISRIMSNDANLDIIRMTHREGFYPLAIAGMLLPMANYLPEEYYESLPQADRAIANKLLYKGERYTFGVSIGAVNESMFYVFYNKDLIAAAGQPDPYDLYLAGEWTYDAMEKIGMAVTRDTDGDNVADQWGMTDISGATALVRFAPSNGVELATKDKDGKFVFNYTSEAALNVLNTISKWRNELKIMSGGNQSFYNGNVAFLSHTHLANARHVTGLNWGLLPLPKGPNAQRHYYPSFDLNTMFLPITAEPNAEKLIALADFLYREEDTYVKLDNLINEYMTDRDQMEVFITGTENWDADGDQFQGTELWSLTSPAIAAVLKGEKGAASAMDEVAPAAQAFLNDLFGQ